MIVLLVLTAGPLAYEFEGLWAVPQGVNGGVVLRVVRQTLSNAQNRLDNKGLKLA